MSSAAEIECKKLCVFRCFHAVTLSVAIQFVLLTVFLLFVNFSILHPISWLTGTFSLIYSFYTWFCIIPLISAIIVYGIFLGNLYLSVPKYYSSRLSWLCSTGLKRIASLFIHSIIGLLTSWLYTSFLSDEYHNLLFECFNNNSCLNSRYIFLSLSGIYSGLFYLFKERLTIDPEIKFPVIQELKYIKIRTSIYSILYNSLIRTFIPTICYTIIYWAFGWIITTWLADQLNSQYDQNLDSLYIIATDFRLIFYVWILSSQILSNMYIMDVFFTVLLTQEIEFSIEKNPLKQHSNEVTIVEALSLSKVPIVQQLASLNLFNLANSKCANKRKQIFALSIPGGHPYNWNQLCGQCLSMINAYTSELAISVKKISTVKSTEYSNMSKPTATETAEKILLRQYNETRGIRNMMEQSNKCQSLNSICEEINATKTVNDNFAEFSKAIDTFCKTLFRSIPGLFYLFGEPEGAKTAYILSKSQDIIWLTQGLAALCASSLQEDRYGVVQCELPAIIKALLQLKLELDKLNNVNLNGKKVNRNCIALKNAVKRSLFRICTIFSSYIKDLNDDPDELRHLQGFINYQEW